MNTEDRIDFIRQKCIEANPDIVALKFGCEIRGTIWMMEYLNDPYIITGGTWICDKHKKYHEECMAEEDGCTGENGVSVRYGDEENGWGEVRLKESEVGEILG